VSERIWQIDTALRLLALQRRHTTFSQSIKKLLASAAAAAAAAEAAATAD